MSEVIERFEGRALTALLIFDDEREADPWVVEVTYKVTGFGYVEAFMSEGEARRYIRRLFKEVEE